MFVWSLTLNCELLLRKGRLEEELEMIRSKSKVEQADSSWNLCPALHMGSKRLQPFPPAVHTASLPAAATCYLRLCQKFHVQNRKHLENSTEA